MVSKVGSLFSKILALVIDISWNARTFVFPVASSILDSPVADFFYHQPIKN
jgi:hypothetical protein